jgi:hypothetical protein
LKERWGHRHAFCRLCDSVKPGALVHVVGQRPTAAAEEAWIKQLAQISEPTVADLLWIDDPHHHLTPTFTDRLVPRQFVDEPGFLTRNLGGWAAIYFGTLGRPAGAPGDPFLQHAEILADYGDRISFFGADLDVVTARLEQETGRDAPRVAAALRRLHGRRAAVSITGARSRTEWIEQVYETIVTGTDFTSTDAPPLPRVLLLDELLGQLQTLELERRAAAAEARRPQEAWIADWQAAHRADSGLQLLLKGEYIVGRHRRSTVLIAPDLGVVVKQPGVEPFHEIALGTRTHAGQQENWPYLTQGGELVTARGRLRLTVQEGLIRKLGQLFHHPIRHSTLCGVTIEPFVHGRTTQDAVLADPARLDPALYEMFVLHQQACELLEIENGDWHSANFVIRDADRRVVHVDWGAARPLRADELTPAGRLARLEQVSNIGYSFNNEELARRTLALHEALVDDAGRMAQVQQRAQALVESGEPEAFLTLA